MELKEYTLQQLGKINPKLFWHGIDNPSDTIPEEFTRTELFDTLVHFAEKHKGQPVLRALVWLRLIEEANLFCEDYIKGPSAKTTCPIIDFHPADEDVVYLNWLTFLYHLKNKYIALHPMERRKDKIVKTLFIWISAKVPARRIPYRKPDVKNSLWADPDIASAIRRIERTIYQLRKPGKKCII